MHIEPGQVGARAGCATHCTELHDTRSRLAYSEARFRKIFEQSPMGFAISDEQGRFVEMNVAMSRVFGRTAEQLIGRSGAEFVHPEDLSLHKNVEELQSQSADGIVRVEARHVFPDGGVHWSELTMTRIPGPHGEKWTLFCGQDVTDRKVAEIALLESRANLASIASVSRAVQLGEDPRPQLVIAVRSVSDAASVTLVEAVDGALRVTRSTSREPDAEATALDEESITATVWRSNRTYLVGDLQNSARQPTPAELDEPEQYVSVMWQPISMQDTVLAALIVAWSRPVAGPSSREVRSVAMIADEAGSSLQAARLRVRLEELASTDPLTGSLNRRAWEEEVHKMIADGRENGCPLTIALIDLDYFKAYNDKFGHTAGDVFLRNFADGARRCLRTTDVLARWGGEEFILALPDCSLDQALAILDRIRAGVPDGCTCSIGATRWHVHELLTSCVTRADSALYEAKRSGRNRVVVTDGPETR